MSGGLILKLKAASSEFEAREKVKSSNSRSGKYVYRLVQNTIEKKMCTSQLRNTVEKYS